MTTRSSHSAEGHGDRNPTFEFYPSYCFPASPTYTTWAKLTAADVHRLTTLPEFAPQGIYFHLNNPIRHICLTGVIVGLDDIPPPLQKPHLPTRRICHLDDSSGAAIEVVWTSEAIPEITGAVLETEEEITSKEAASREADLGEPAPKKKVFLGRGLDIGSMVRVKGTITTFRGTKQAIARKVAVLRDTMAELAAWRSGVEWRVGVLGIGVWVLGEEQRNLLERMARGEVVEDREDGEERRERRARRERREKRRREKGLKKEGEKDLEVCVNVDDHRTKKPEKSEADMRKHRKKRPDNPAAEDGEEADNGKQQKGRRIDHLDALGL